MTALSDIKKILVTTDFSDEASVAYDYARSLADVIGPLNVTITLLTVVEDLQATNVSFGYGLTFVDVEGILEQATVEAGKKAEEIAAAEFPNHTVETKIINTTRSVPREILQYVKDSGVDLIVMATHGRSGVERLMLGSVTDKLLRESECPVMVIPVKE